MLVVLQSRTFAPQFRNVTSVLVRFVLEATAFRGCCQFELSAVWIHRFRLVAGFFF